MKEPLIEIPMQTLLDLHARFIEGQTSLTKKEIDSVILLLQAYERITKSESELDGGFDKACRKIELADKIIAKIQAKEMEGLARAIDEYQRQS